MKRIFQWTFFPVSMVAGTAAIGWSLAHHFAPATVAMAIPIFFLVLLAICERLLPYEPEWNRNHGDVAADLSSIATVAFGLESLFKVGGPLLVVAAFSLLHLSPGWHLIPHDWPLWAQSILVIGFIEFVKYWFHRLGHESSFWWPLHSVHHAVKRVYLLNGFRIHPLYHLGTYLLGYFPCILVGAAPETLLVHVVILGIAGGFQHCNVDLRYGPLNYIFSTNEIHRWHHSTLVAEGNRNYGAIFSVFDVLFGTYYNVPGQRPAVIGMAEEEGYPINDYWRQLAIPFTYRRVVKSSSAAAPVAAPRRSVG